MIVSGQYLGFLHGSLALALVACSAAPQPIVSDRPRTDVAQNVPALIELLGDESSEARDRAEAELTGLGAAIEAPLRAALYGARDPEIRGRAGRILREIARQRLVPEALAQYVRARGLFDDGRLEEAATLCRLALEIDPDLACAKALLYETETIAGPRPAGQVPFKAVDFSAIFERAARDLEAGYRDSARQQLHLLIDYHGWSLPPNRELDGLAARAREILEKNR